MAVGASQPTVVASKDGRIGMKNQMQVTNQRFKIHIFSASSFRVGLRILTLGLCNILYAGKCYGRSSCNLWC
jgi:hypothetical protein